jgi:RHS repeat-associated protein
MKLAKHALAVALFPVLTTSNALAAVGRTQGAADVSNTGEASYSIPIFTPQGTHGMTPQLAFVFSHRNTSTLLGAGWSIAGLSAITRCRKTWISDGEARDVRNDLSDRFCLDGNKLRWTSGTYGTAGATYQTEIETFSRVTSYDVAGNGPAYFFVERKDGVIYEYGNTPDSRIESLGQATARSWALNRIRDRSGNEINFIYNEDTTNGAYRIESVRYTTNVAQSLTSAYDVDFVWETKPTNEIDSGYIAGSKVKQITRLDRVDVTYNTTTLVRRYELTYEGALSSTSKSRLASIQECAGATPDCFPATTFSYQNGTSGLGSETNLWPYTLTTPWPMDLNGDGREDLVYSSTSTSGTGTWMVAFANSSGTYNTPFSTGVTNTNFLGAIPIDYNADGLEDLLVPYASGTWWIMYGSASGLSAPANTGAPATGTGADAGALDVNGDGLDDLAWADRTGGYSGGDSVSYRLREWGGAFSAAVYLLVPPAPVNTRIEFGVFGGLGRNMPRRLPDFNGDGRDDFVYRRTTRTPKASGGFNFTHFLVLICPGGTCGAVSLGSSASGVPSHGDFNGDGKSDVLYLNSSGVLAVSFSTGGGISSAQVVGGGSAGWAVLDWDADGMDDVLTVSGGVWQLRRATGEGFASAVSTGLTTAGAATVADINGDGLHDLVHLVGTDLRFRSHAGSYPDLLQTATDGFGNFSTFSYASLTNYNLYTKQTGASYPTQEYVGPLYVVSNVANSNGIGGTFNLQSLYYEGARLDLQGRGFLGFTFRAWVDSRDGTAQRRSYSQTFPYIGAVTNARRTQEPSGTAITEVQTSYSSHSYGSAFETRSLPFASQITNYDREAGGTFNGALVRTTVTTALVHAATGTPYDVTTTVTEPASGANGVQPGASYVQRVYSPTAFFSDAPSTWCRGRPGQTQVITSHNQFGGSSITRTTDVTWDSTACRPTTIVEESGHAQLQVTRTIGYDAFGNVDSDSVTGIGMTARTSTANWGATGQFPTSLTNALSQTTTRTWNHAFGMPASETDPNSIAVSWLYDDFGRRILENRPDGTYTTYEYNAWTICDPRHKSYVRATPHTSGGAPITYQYVFLDQLDRPISEYHLSFSTTSWDTVIRTYDALGRVSTEGVPFSAGTCSSYTPSYVSTFQYDLLGRPTQVSRPTSDSNPALQTATIYYEGLTARFVDPMSKQSTKVANVAGALARSIDHDSYHQNFDYDGFGNVVRVTDSLSNTLQSNTFNIRGVRTAQTDMDAGSWIFMPNALGEITTQTDAKSQNTTFAYDLLGRLTSRTEPEGTSTFTFGTSAPSIGRLASMSGPGYSEGFTYDGIGRLETRSIASDATYAFDYTYNNHGSIDTLTYPTSTSGYRLKLQYEYQSGQLLRVKDFNAPTTVFWQANAKDAWGHIIDETLGNGTNTVRGFDLATGEIDSIYSVRSDVIHQDQSYTWNAVGSLTERRNNGLSLIETFGYDNLHRLTSTAGPENSTFTYDLMGNLLSKTGVGSYTYHASKKHQAITAGGSSYGYDANGNMTNRAGSTVSWFSYNLPSTINGPSSNTSQFFYGPDRQRWKQTASYAGTTEETIYIGGLIEKATLGGVTSWRHYIAGSSGAAAIYIRRSNGTTETDYLLKDHLGSLEMITRSNGTQMARASSDAWGRRRNGGTWSGNPAGSEWTAITDTTRRGFTSHEQLDNLGLVHMNGRVFDPVLARFLSADPIVQAPGFTQSWNRYSYTFNNPLSYTDPSGFEGKKRVRPINPDDPDPREPRTAPSPGAPRVVHPIDFHNWMASYVTPGFFGTGGTGIGLGLGRNLGSANSQPVSAAPVNASSDSTNGGTVDWTKVRDTLADGWGDFKYNVQCIWTCQWPGDGSLEANLAGLPVVPIVGAENATARLAVAAERGISVLGRHPAYLRLGESIPSRYFNVPKWIWDRMSPALQLAANTRFLDRLITRGDEVLLATNAATARAGTYFAWEIEYLTARGYTLSADGWRLLPPGMR